MKKINEIVKKKTDVKTSEKTENLWNSVNVPAVNTCDYLAEARGFYPFNYGIISNLIIEFIDGVKPSSVLDAGTTYDDVAKVEPSEFDTYGIIRVIHTQYDIQNLKKPNGFGIYCNNDNILMVLTNGSTFKEEVLEVKVIA